MIHLPRVYLSHVTARRRSALALGFVLVASALVAAPASPGAAFDVPGGGAASDNAAASSASTAANPSATPIAVTTPKPGYDAVGRWIAGLAAGDTQSPTPSPSPTCTAYCTDVPVPAPESTPDPASAVSFKLHVPIFEYHRVKPFNGEHGFSHDLIVPPQTFAAQMDAMAAAGWKTITMGELGDDLRFGIAPPPKSFVVTLDDGYEDGYQNAFPLLLEHGFKATFFVIAGRIGSPLYLTPFELGQLVRAGMEIGNHSYSHQDVAAMTPDRLVGEIYGASAIISRYTGSWPKSFAYPKGFTSGVVQDYLSRVPGLNTAVLESGSKPESWSIRWQLTRIRVGPATYPSELVDRASRY